MHFDITSFVIKSFVIYFFSPLNKERNSFRSGFLRIMEPQPVGWRENILGQLKQRNRTEVAPFQAILLLQARLAERSSQLQQDNATLTTSHEKLKEEKVQLEALLLARTAATQVADSHTIHELQMKMFSLQEELTELHR